MLERNFSPTTVALREMWIRHFVEWCGERSIQKPVEVTRPILERYQRHWYTHRKANGRPLSFRSQLTRIVPLRSLFRWLTRQGVITANPAADLDLPKTTRPLPKHVLTPREVDAVIGIPDVQEPLGLRDRAILEVLWSTGIRRMELVALATYDLEPERGTLRVRKGKGQKERVVPIGERALRWIGKYLDEVRPKLVGGMDEHFLFLNAEGEPIGLDYLSNLVRDYVIKADLGKTGAAHLFRHSCATAMLEGGADVRLVQELLGHALLTTTQIYTHVTINRLLDEHRRCHPSALLHPGSKATPTGDAVISSEKMGASEGVLDALGDDEDEDDS
jgi:integrase/recombinase XerD